ncbi:hypothetical protein [Nitratireductor sp. ZSWI3]|uniref:hypothetical protein n=1 Tax=Nitratireductor sp. ZSWI3 TaxID=2966359 RepID=UPI00214FB036|nr:hypothetical protein [Nitratireductor sp. ZSWI3]MCR4265336.1 hypothetical protein [Nitratireductor sp. ZSWI3]
MSSAIFRQLASGGEEHRPDRLFRAAVSAFTSLTRPTRREIAQLDDLALPLFPLVPVETRRYAAAVLCECASPPPGLLRRLCDEPVEVCAPLLVRSNALSDVDLIDLIARHGLPHARVIGRRAVLHPAIAALIRALATQENDRGGTAARPAFRRSTGLEDGVRDRLRLMMRAANAPGEAGASQASRPVPQYLADDRNAALRHTALSGTAADFEAELARRLGIPLARARHISTYATCSKLMIALRALMIEDAEAFLLTATRYPEQLLNRNAIRRFVERYRSIAPETVREHLERWRKDPSPAEPVPSKVQSAVTSK